MRKLLSTVAFCFVLVLSAAVLAQPVYAQQHALPVAFNKPAGCNLKQLNTLFESSWGCSFSSADDRFREIIVSLHTFSFEAVSGKKLGGLNQRQLTSELNSVLRHSQRHRKTNAPRGYQRIETVNLKYPNWVSGLNTCSRTRDVYPSQRSGKKRDRLDLHCIAVDRNSGSLYQLIFTYHEINPATQSVSPLFSEDARLVVETVRPTVP